MTGSVEVAVDTLADPRLVDAGVPESIQAAAEAKAKAEALAERKGVTEESVAPQVTSAAQKITVAGRKILDDVTWLITPVTVSASSARTAPANPRCSSSSTARSRRQPGMSTSARP